MSDIPMGGGLFGLPLSPEDRAQYEEAHKRWEMQVDERGHAQDALFNELSQEHLFTISLMFRSLHNVHPDEAVTRAAYWDGLATSALKFRFNVCPFCNKNHDEEAMKVFTEGIKVDIDPTPAKEGPEWEFPAPKADTAGYVNQSLPQKGGSVPSLFEDDEKNSRTKDADLDAEFSDEQLANMELYNLDDLRDEDTKALIGFICKGCGLRYVSIEDRMLRPAGVEGCHGCMSKAAWG